MQIPQFSLVQITKLRSTVCVVFESALGTGESEQSYLPPADKADKMGTGMQPSSEGGGGNQDARREPPRPPWAMHRPEGGPA